MGNTYPSSEGCSDQRRHSSIEVRFRKPVTLLGSFSWAQLKGWLLKCGQSPLQKATQDTLYSESRMALPAKMESPPLVFPSLCTPALPQGHVPIGQGYKQVPRRGWHTGEGLTTPFPLTRDVNNQQAHVMIFSKWALLNSLYDGCLTWRISTYMCVYAWKLSEF